MTDEESGIRLLLVSNFYPPSFVGGAELMAHFHAKKLTRKGVKVYVLSTKYDNTVAAYSIVREEHEGIPVFRIVMPPQDMQGCSNFLNPQVDLRFQEIFSVIKPQIVHAHNIAGLSINLLSLANSLGASTVVTLHDHWGYCYRNIILDKNGNLCQPKTSCTGCGVEFSLHEKTYPMELRQSYLRYIFNQVDLILPPSDYLNQCYANAGIHGRKLEVLWYGVDNDRYSSITRLPSKKIRFTFSGYLGEHKGILVLLKAFSNLNKTKVKAFLNIAGHLDQECKKFVYENKLTKNVRFWGKVPNHKIEEVYAETDVLILPSIWPENQPLSIAEAMVSGCPVITTNLGGSVELVQDGINGYWVDRNDPSELTEIMRRFIDHPELLEEMGNKAKSSMLSNCMDKRINQLINLYHDLEKRRGENIPIDFSVVIADDCKQDFLHDTLCYYRGSPMNIVPVEWLPNQGKHQFQVLWLHSGKISPERAIKMAEKYHSVLLVPIQRTDLVNLCKEKKAGLYYRDALEAAVCLEYMKKFDIRKSVLTSPQLERT